MIVLVAFDVVANLTPIDRNRLTLVESEYESIQQLPIGQVGTVLEVYSGESPRYLVEFADPQGREYAMAILQHTEVLALHCELSLAPMVMVVADSITV
jgi:hypothetical protein